MCTILWFIIETKEIRADIRLGIYKNRAVVECGIGLHYFQRESINDQPNRHIVIISITCWNFFFSKSVEIGSQNSTVHSIKDHIESERDSQVLMLRELWMHSDFVRW